MVWGDWIAIAGLVMALASLGLHFKRYVSDRRRDDRRDLSDLAVSLIQLKVAALAHLAGANPDTMRELTARLDTARYLAERSTSGDVQTAVRHAIAVAERFEERAVRVMEDAEVELPRALADAVESALATIGVRSDDLRWSGRTKARR